MTLLLLPDVEAAVSQYLRDDDDVAALVEARVFGIIPHNDDERLPLIRITQFDSVNRAVAWLDSPLLQIDAYAAVHGETLATKSHASLIGRTARAALDAMTGAFGDAVITGVATSGWRYDPDPTYKPARHRYQFTASVTAHPINTGS